MQCKSVILEKIHIGEIYVMNSWSIEELYPELVLYCELKWEVVGNKT